MNLVWHWYNLSQYIWMTDFNRLQLYDTAAVGLFPEEDMYGWMVKPELCGLNDNKIKGCKEVIGMHVVSREACDGRKQEQERKPGEWIQILC